ncbi:MAG: class I tRNA ligase family protein [Actinobacteria bacterium]|nr:class I tRNA ligase family protein [Actinomycetota bacterium]
MATAAASVPNPSDIARAEKFTREVFVHAGETTEAALAPGTARRRALEAALAEIEAGAKVPSTEWRRRYSLMLGLERVLSDDEPKLADGTSLNPHQVDALSGTLTALLAEAQRQNGNAAANGAPPAAAPVLAVDDEDEDFEEPASTATAVDHDDDDEPEVIEPLDFEVVIDIGDDDDEEEAEEESEEDGVGGDDFVFDEDQLDEQPDDPNAHKRFWFEHATGAGKTVAAMGFVDASRTGGILILTHRRNLVDQFHGELKDRGYAKRVTPALLKGQDAANGPVTVETYQWFVRNAGNISPAYSIVICDEAHTALGEKTSAAIREWSGPIFIGMTATGALIARHVTDLFPTQTSRFDLAQAARRGVIAPLRCVRIPPGPGVRTIAKVPLRRGEPVAVIGSYDHVRLPVAYHWPDDTPDLQTWYPTSVLVTGYDINTFWVSRMLMIGLHLLDDVPFNTVMNHGLVRDRFGKKMSKSFGNVIDPLELIDAYGADALRFALLRAASPGQDVPLAEEWVKGARNFANKLWNAGRFVLAKLPDRPATADLDSLELEVEDRWILSRLETARAATDEAYACYDLGRAAQTLYHFLWDEFCDWYLELIKLRSDAAVPAVLTTVLDVALRLLHPIMPFVTEELWRTLQGGGEVTLVRASWPEAAAQRRNESAEDAMATLQETVTALRRFRAVHGLVPSRRIDVTAVAGEPQRSLLADGVRAISRLAGVDTWDFAADAAAAESGPVGKVVIPGAELFIPLAGVVDLDDVKLDTDCLRTLNRRQAWQFHMLPLNRDPELNVATTAESLVRSVNFSSRSIDEPVHIMIAERAQLREFLMRHYPVPEFLAQYASEM